MEKLSAAEQFIAGTIMFKAFEDELQKIAACKGKAPKSIKMIKKADLDLGDAAVGGGLGIAGYHGYKQFQKNPEYFSNVGKALKGQTSGFKVGKTLAKVVTKGKV